MKGAAPQKTTAQTAALQETVRRAEKAKADDLSDVVTKMIKENKPVVNSWFRSKTEQPFWGAQAQPKPLRFPKTSELMIPAGSRLKDVIKNMNMRQRTSPGYGGMNIAMNPQTTINGASAGQEQALARQFERVLQDSNRALIARLKEARNYEERLGYV